MCPIPAYWVLTELDLKIELAKLSNIIGDAVGELKSRWSRRGYEIMDIIDGKVPVLRRGRLELCSRW